MFKTSNEIPILLLTMREKFSFTLSTEIFSFFSSSRMWLDLNMWAWTCSRSRCERCSSHTVKPALSVKAWNVKRCWEEMVRYCRHVRRSFCQQIRSDTTVLNLSLLQLFNLYHINRRKSTSVRGKLKQNIYKYILWSDGRYEAGCTALGHCA